MADRAEIFRAADIVAQVLCYGSNDKTGDADLPLLHKDQVLVGFLRPLGGLNTIQQIAERGVTALSVELMPRTTRAQSMDVLSSMATICGYKARGDRRGHAAENFSDAHHGGGNDHCRRACL